MRRTLWDISPEDSNVTYYMPLKFGSKLPPMNMSILRPSRTEYTQAPSTAVFPAAPTNPSPRIVGRRVMALTENALRRWVIGSCPSQHLFTVQYQIEQKTATEAVEISCQLYRLYSAYYYDFEAVIVNHK
jgi:hypothetical protein